MKPPFMVFAPTAFFSFSTPTIMGNRKGSPETILQFFTLIVFLTSSSLAVNLNEGRSNNAPVTSNLDNLSSNQEKAFMEQQSNYFSETLKRIIESKKKHYSEDENVETDMENPRSLVYHESAEMQVAPRRKRSLSSDEDDSDEYDEYEENPKKGRGCPRNIRRCLAQQRRRPYHFHRFNSYDEDSSDEGGVHYHRVRNNDIGSRQCEEGGRKKAKFYRFPCSRYSNQKYKFDDDDADDDDDGSSESKEIKGNGKGPDANNGANGNDKLSSQIYGPNNAAGGAGDNAAKDGSPKNGGRPKKGKGRARSKNRGRRGRRPGQRRGSSRNGRGRKNGGPDEPAVVVPFDDEYYDTDDDENPVVSKNEPKGDAPPPPSPIPAIEAAPVSDTQPVNNNNGGAAPQESGSGSGNGEYRDPHNLQYIYGTNSVREGEGRPNPTGIDNAPNINDTRIRESARRDNDLTWDAANNSHNGSAVALSDAVDGTSDANAISQVGKDAIAIATNGSEANALAATTGGDGEALAASETGGAGGASSSALNSGTGISRSSAISTGEGADAKADAIAQNNNATSSSQAANGGDATSNALTQENGHAASNAAATAGGSSQSNALSNGEGDAHASSLTDGGGNSNAMSKSQGGNAQSDSMAKDDGKAYSASWAQGDGNATSNSLSSGDGSGSRAEAQSEGKGNTQANAFQQKKGKETEKFDVKKVMDGLGAYSGRDHMNDNFFHGKDRKKSKDGSTSKPNKNKAKKD